ncbi:YkgJ family cysteine cluster protein [Bradyrhizobium sp. Pha-3]|uniref:YkgJ family cysteine cluster protein n=1 Tax=Bradyrhizobium sp. Pha-3 TaxID=208375 RepID=UPI0035D5269C
MSLLASVPGGQRPSVRAIVGRILGASWESPTGSQARRTFGGGHTGPSERHFQVCRNKAIRVNPCEILRLARHLGISTTQFIKNHTEAGGTVLRSKEDGDCGFLGERGCSVHPDRPLACRIYPLARRVAGQSCFHRARLFENFPRPGPHDASRPLSIRRTGEAAPAFVRTR